MRTLLKNEFYRAFHNPITALAFGIGTAAALAHVFLHVLPLGKYINSGSYPLSLFQHWIGGENISVWPVLFYLTAPLLGAMPHLRTMYLDRKEGYVKNIFVRTGKMKYCAAKYLATFVSSGVIILWPLVLDFCISALILPALLPQASTGLYPIHQLSLWGSLFYEQPFLYLLL